MDQYLLEPPCFWYVEADCVEQRLENIALQRKQVNNGGDPAAYAVRDRGGTHAVVCVRVLSWYNSSLDV